MKNIVVMMAGGLLLTALLAAGAPPATGAPQATAEAPAGMAPIPAGTFWMGRNHSFLFDELNWTLRPRLDDRPVHEVDVDAFYMDKYETTNADYEKFTTATGHAKPWHWPGGKVNEGLAKLPVYNVTWADAEAYCAWAGKRLPTEAEWEKAARGGLERKLYEWGDELEYPKPAAAPANAGAAAAGAPGAAASAAPAAAPAPAAGGRGGGGGQKRAHYGHPNSPAPIGSFEPNGYGLYDMTGNVWEWVNDWYEKNYYLMTSDKNPQGPASGGYKVARGSGWSSTEDMPQRSILGVHYRNYADPVQTSNVLGFRCAKSVDSSPNTP
jgi:formylglycine-generating enzyme required for sulfatase activity